ncbi:hypothetical protein AAMO2058_000442700 [Amorphochlora amoebiformis]
MSSSSIVGSKECEPLFFENKYEKSFFSYRHAYVWICLIVIVISSPDRAASTRSRSPHIVKNQPGCRAKTGKTYTPLLDVSYNDTSRYFRWGKWSSNAATPKHPSETNEFKAFNRGFSRKRSSKMSLSGGPPLTFENLKNTALTSTTIVVNTAIWFYLWNFNVNIEKFGYQYEKVVQGKELWRFFSASYAHVHPLHLVFNMASLWNASIMEVYLGHMIYAKYTFILVVLSMATVTVFYYVMIRYFERPHYRHLYSLGYSCVVFGWMMIQCEYFGGHMSYFGLVIPARLSPFLALIITSIIVPRASFIGHLSGIIIGELISRGVFDWHTLILTLTLTTLTLTLIRIPTLTNITVNFNPNHNPNPNSNPIPNSNPNPNLKPKSNPS